MRSIDPTFGEVGKSPQVEENITKNQTTSWKYKQYENNKVNCLVPHLGKYTVRVTKVKQNY